MYNVDLKVGETLIIGDIWVTVAAKSGQSTRLVVKADRSIPIQRLEQPPGKAARVPKNPLV